MKTIKLSKAEIEHLLTLIRVDERQCGNIGLYPKNKYWKRSNRIKLKLQTFKNRI
jgi:hypothetical protein